MITHSTSVPKTALSKFATIVILLYPVLSIYSFGNEYINVGFLTSIPVFLLLFIRFLTTKKLTISGVALSMVTLWIVFLIITIISLFGNNVFSFGKSAGRFGLWSYYILMLALSSKYIDKQYAAKQLSLLGSLFSIILLFEIGWWLITGSALSLYLIPAMSPKVNTVYANIGGFTIIRPSSLFVEPSHFGYYAAISLTVSLRCLPKEKKTKIRCVIISAAMLLSTSASAVYLLIIIYILQIMENRSKITSILGFIFAGILCTSIPFVSDVVMYGSSRLVISSSRLLSFVSYINTESIFRNLFGCGIGNQTAYYQRYLSENISSFLSGFGRIVVETGYVGIISYLLVMIIAFRKTTSRTKIFLLLFFVMNLFETTIFGWYLVLILMWVEFSPNDHVGGYDMKYIRQNEIELELGAHRYDT